MNPNKTPCLLERNNHLSGTPENSRKQTFHLHLFRSIFKEAPRALFLSRFSLRPNVLSFFPAVKISDPGFGLTEDAKTEFPSGNSKLYQNITETSKVRKQKTKPPQKFPVGFCVKLVFKSVPSKPSFLSPKSQPREAPKN